MHRCEWCGTDPLYVSYHDNEWGVPEYSSQRLWEKLVLDGFQAGLSWLTILKKRDNFREAFKGFNPCEVSEFTQKDIESLMLNKGIVRNRNKIVSTIKGAQIWQDIESSIGFNNYVWDFVDGKPIQNKFISMTDVPKFTDLSIKISKDLKSRGFNFCGPTIVYAWMEACGIVNNHLVSCPCYEKIRNS
ncbi:possible 3-methyladenine DNA glycosylase I [Rhodobacterales bacterium HTCC2255]|nr:possible 3-methyladenine DNA glycosylase I [Rhodobacterales bacterium HTCC2255]